jgi:hypothetical protein
MPCRKVFNERPQLAVRRFNVVPISDQQRACSDESRPLVAVHKRVILHNPRKDGDGKCDDVLLFAVVPEITGTPTRALKFVGLQEAVLVS